MSSVLDRPLVLVVDDDPRNTALLEEMVAPIGVALETAGSGPMCLKLAAERRPDAILLDIVMPGMDGIDTCRQLKADPALRDIPVVFITALGDTRHHAAAIDAGAIGFITKPVQAALVEASVRNALRLRRLTAEVADLRLQRAALSGMLVHDVNNLLGVILAHARLLLATGALPAAERDAVTTIRRAGEDLEQLTVSLLEIERLESGAARPRLELLDAWELLAVRGRLHEPNAAARRVALVLREPAAGASAMVRADPDLLGRVFDNLLLNAVELSPEGGSVVLDAIPAGAHVAWELSISNEGPAIARDRQRRLFTRFVELAGPAATGGAARRGLGLGLAFCKMAVEAMGGRIVLESPLPGREAGARFSVTLGR